MAAGEAGREKTTLGIPLALRPFFQEYDFEHLDPDRNEFTVIDRTLAWGDIAELRWLFERYGEARLRDWVREYGWRTLPRRSFGFWRVFFDLQDYKSGERIWPH